MWESQVSGNQLPANEVRNAHAAPAQVSPACTCGFAVT